MILFILHNKVIGFMKGLLKSELTLYKSDQCISLSRHSDWSQSDQSCLFYFNTFLVVPRQPLVCRLTTWKFLLWKLPSHHPHLSTGSLLPSSAVQPTLFCNLIDTRGYVLIQLYRLFYWGPVNSLVISPMPSLLS